MFYERLEKKALRDRFANMRTERSRFNNVTVNGMKSSCETIYFRKNYQLFE